MGLLQKSQQKKFKNRIKQYKMIKNLFIPRKKLFREIKNNGSFSSGTFRSIFGT